MREIAVLVHSLVWGPWTLVMFLGVGIWMTVRLRGFQILGIRRWWSATAGSLLREDADEKRPDDGTKITPFQSACTALAATIGTGNIAGVATALTCGGPGALFWMWISAAIGMMTAYTETCLGQQYRYRGKDGQWMCGPMVYMERGLGCPWMGTMYAGLAALASFGMGSMVQSNSVGSTLRFGLSIPEWVSGLAVTALAGLVILGGIGRISQVAQRLMPVSAGIYFIFSVIVILSCAGELPGIFRMIFQEAFQLRSAAGGVGGFVLSRSVRYGLSRGVFSNEAGLGSLAVLHGAAEDTTPEQQGMWAMFEVFFDTIVVCSLTGLVILCIEASWGIPDGAEGAALAAWCFSKRLGLLGEVLVSGAMVIFAFATIIAWFYLGKQTASYLMERIFKGKYAGKRCEGLYTALYLGSVFTGCVWRLDLIWLVSDIWNGLMAYPNLLAVMLLCREVRRPKF